jgi:murein DD-endopeptidase MepM/ murein hydrolase activator NlpD
MARRWCLVLPLTLALSIAGAPTLRASEFEGSPWGWPIQGPLLRTFDPPEDPYGAGHRGIDIVAPVGTTIVAPADGLVTFAGKVGGQSFITLDHGGGLTSTCSWVSGFFVRKGDVVLRGVPIASSGTGHAGLLPAHLHFGVRLDGAYVDPLNFLGPPPVAELIHLAPIPVPILTLP